MHIISLQNRLHTNKFINRQYQNTLYPYAQSSIAGGPQTSQTIDPPQSPSFPSTARCFLTFFDPYAFIDPLNSPIDPWGSIQNDLETPEEDK